MRHAEPVMGTVVSIDVRTPGHDEGARSAIDQVVRWLHWVDNTFSTYKTASEVNRLDRGELVVEECHPHVASVLELCEVLHARTGGYFDAWASGHLDPSGVVKGWSIDQASALLVAAGWPDHCIDGGGDVRLRGRPVAVSDRCDPAAPGPAAPDPADPDPADPTVGSGAPPRWQVALRHPFHPDAFCAVVALESGAVATSGTYERGFHVIDPHHRRPATAIAALSVIGPDLTMADAYATAALAMGLDALEWLSELPDHEALIVDASGNGWETPGFGRYRLGGLGVGPSAQASTTTMARG